MFLEKSIMSQCSWSFGYKLYHFILLVVCVIRGPIYSMKFWITIKNLFCDLDLWPPESYQFILEAKWMIVLTWIMLMRMGQTRCGTGPENNTPSAAAITRVETRKNISWCLWPIWGLMGQTRWTVEHCSCAQSGSCHVTPFRLHLLFSVSVQCWLWSINNVDTTV